MSKFMKSIALSLTGFLTIMLYIGCTPGKAQTRSNDYKGNFGTEEYESFDTNDKTGDDTIPKYSNNSVQKVNGSNGNNYSNSNNSGSGYENYDKGNGYSSQGYTNNTAGVKNNGYQENSQNQGFEVSDGYGSNNGNNVYVRNSNNGGQYSENRYYQKGAASWYGREFHGRVTASGERFDMNTYTAAHKTLPFGTILEVRNLQNGKSVRIKVNDRGPYRGNRIIDLSFAAAKELDMIGSGTAVVGINVIKMGNNGTTYTNNNKSKYVEPVSEKDLNQGYSEKSNNSGYVDSTLKLQAGAFYSRNNAEKLRAQIESRTGKTVRVIRDGDFFKVRVEGFINSQEAEKVRDELTNDRITSFIVK